MLKFPSSWRAVNSMLYGSVERTYVWEKLHSLLWEGTDHSSCIQLCMLPYRSRRSEISCLFWWDCRSLTQNIRSCTFLYRRRGCSFARRYHSRFFLQVDCSGRFGVDCLNVRNASSGFCPTLCSILQ